MVTKNECSVRRRIVVMQKPRVVCPKYLLKRCFKHFSPTWSNHGRPYATLNVSATESLFCKTKVNGTLFLNKFRHCKNRKNHFYSFRKHKRNYVTNDEIDMKFGTDVSNSRTNIKIKEFARIG